MRENKGFSLIELLIVLAILGIIAAVAIPSLAQSKLAANEASAIASVRTIGTAQFTYWTNGQSTFADSFAALVAEGYLDDALGTGQKDGFQFVITGEIADFSVVATPLSANTGKRSFFIDESGVIRYAVGGAPNETSPPLDGSGGGGGSGGSGGSGS